MGFFDSLGGIFDSIGTGIGNVLGATIPGSGSTVGGALAGIGVELLRNKVVGTPVGGAINRALIPAQAQTAMGGFGGGGFGAPLGRGALNPIQSGGIWRSQPSPVVNQGGFTPAMATVLPGGAMVGDQGGIADFFGGNPGFNCPVLFRPTLLANGTGSASPMSQIMVPNPVTGAPTLFKSAGRILLTSSDITAHRRVNALARKAARRRPR